MQKEYYNELSYRATIGIVDFTESPEEGIHLKEIKNKALTDGEACVNSVSFEDKSRGKALQLFVIRK